MGRDTWWDRHSPCFESRVDLESDVRPFRAATSRSKLRTQRINATSEVNLSDYFVHETAVVDAPCRIGAGTRIWHFSHIMPDCDIGERVQHRPERRRLPRLRDRQRLQDPEQRLDLHRRDPRGRRVLRPVDGVHQRDQSARVHRAQGRVPPHAGQAGRVASAPTPRSSAASRWADIASSAPARSSPATCRTTRLIYGNPARLHGWTCYCGVQLPLGVDSRRTEEGRCRGLRTRPTFAKASTVSESKPRKRATGK